MSTGPRLKSKPMRPQLISAFIFVAMSLTHASPMFRNQAVALAQTRAAAQQKSVVFIVTKDAGAEAQVEPVAIVNSGGMFEEPVSGGADKNALSKFFGDYYKSGTKYRMIFGGAEAGSVTVREAMRAECAPMAASADISTNAKLGGNVMALATDSAQTLRANSSRRAPTESERAAVLQLAKSIFKQKRVSASALERSTSTLNLTATDLEGDGREELIGTYVVKTSPKVRDTLFLIVAPQGASFRAVVKKHERINARSMMDPTQIDSVGDGALLTEMFIEQFDVDGDGVGELFTISRSFEGTAYKAYRRQRGTWRMVHEFYSYRCAY